MYLGYVVAPSIPFKAITPLSSYSNDTWKAATWYELTDKDDTTNKKIKYDENGDPNKYFQNNGVSTTYEKVSEYAFIGDPYELRVILRSETSGATPSFLGATGTLDTETPLTAASTDATAGYKWEIPYDATEGSFLLQLYKGAGNWYWNTEGTNQNVAYSTANSTRLKVLELPKYTYNYNIVDKSGRIAVKASIEQPIFSPLLTSVSSTSSSLPPIIVSPYLVGETLTFYDEYTNRNGDGVTNRRDFHEPSEQTPITETPAVNNQNIYVTYTTAHLDDKPINLSEDQEFNVRLNGEYIWYDATDNSIKTNAAPTQENLESKVYLWKLRNKDPYNMLIDNLGAREDLPTPETHVAGQTENPDVYDDNGTRTNPERQKGAWVKLEAGDLADAMGLEFTTVRANAQPFIAKSSLHILVFQVV